MLVINAGVSIVNATVDILLYADDIALLAPSETNGEFPPSHAHPHSCGLENKWVTLVTCPKTLVTWEML